MKKATVAIIAGLGLMLASTSTLSAGCGCPKIHFGCKKHKVVKHHKKSCGCPKFHLPKCSKHKHVKKHRSCSFHLPCPHFGCSK